MSLEPNYRNIIFDTLKEMPDLIFFLTSNDGYIQDASEEAEKFFSIDNSEIVKKFNINDLLPNMRLQEVFSKVSKQGKISLTTELKCNKALFIVSVTIKKIVDKDLELFIFFIKDFLCNEKSKKVSKSINSVSSILKSTIEPEDAIKIILEKINNNFETDLPCLFLLQDFCLNIKVNEKSRERFSIPDKLVLTDHIELANFVKSKKILIINENISDNVLVKALNLIEIEQVMLIPLVIQDSLFGFVALFNKKRTEYSTEDLNMIELLASTMAYILNNHEMKEVFDVQLKLLRDNVIKKSKAINLIKIQNEKILEADKIKNEFISHISHELRTPLNAIIGFSEILKLKVFGDLNEKQEEYMGDINASGHHLLGMINDILDLTKIESQKITMNLDDFSVELGINEVINVLIALSGQKNIVVKDNLKHTHDKIYSDQRKFQQILYNLISNAIKFSYSDSIIEVISEDTMIGDIRAISVSVKDSGIGIAIEDQERIFTKFVQVENKKIRTSAGTGLGLTITRQLVEMLGGLIELKSKPDEGSTFTFKIPIVCIDKN